MNYKYVLRRMPKFKRVMFDSKLMWKRISLNNNKGVKFMRNRNFFSGVACVGLFANLFVALAGKNLEVGMASLFTNVGSVAIASALVFFILSTKSEAQEQVEREEFYRDIDAVYRHVDDRIRDVNHDVMNLGRECSTKCSVKK